MKYLAVMMFPGGWEWFVILFVALLIFGSRLPKMLRQMGSAIADFRKGLKDTDKTQEIEHEQT